MKDFAAAPFVFKALKFVLFLSSQQYNKTKTKTKTCHVTLKVTAP